MEYVEDEARASEILSGLLTVSEHGEDRAKKHPSVTDLIYCLTKNYWDTTPEAQKIEPTDQTKVYWVLGLGLEKALIGHLENEVKEGEYEGIWYHPDLLREGRLLELKTTRASSKTWNPERMSEGWRRQLYAYMHINDVTEAEYAVLHIIQADFKVWKLNVPQFDLEINWAWMLDRKEIWDRLASGTIPAEPYKYNMDWECRNCVYSTRCEALQYVAGG